MFFVGVFLGGRMGSGVGWGESDIFQVFFNTKPLWQTQSRLREE